MPELPEVETTVKGLSVILNQKISSVKIHTSKLRFIIPNNIVNILRNSKISNLRRIAKLIIIDLDIDCLLYTSPSPRDTVTSRMPSSA